MSDGGFGKGMRDFMQKRRKKKAQQGKIKTPNANHGLSGQAGKVGDALVKRHDRLTKI